MHLVRDCHFRWLEIVQRSSPRCNAPAFDLHGHFERQRADEERARKSQEEAQQRAQEEAQHATLGHLLNTYTGSTLYAAASGAWARLVPTCNQLDSAGHRGWDDNEETRFMDAIYGRNRGAIIFY